MYNPKVRYVCPMCVVRSMQPGLSFQGETLRSACMALLPSGCCFRVWSMLMAAVARQLCLDGLASEYLSLPGRCQQEAVVAGVCTRVAV